jgi:hypothetical protein
MGNWRKKKPEGHHTNRPLKGHARGPRARSFCLRSVSGSERAPQSRRRLRSIPQADQLLYRWQLIRLFLDEARTR